MCYKPAICLAALLCFAMTVSYAQSVDSVSGKLLNFPARFFGRIKSKAASLDQQIAQQTEKYLQRLASQENKLRKKLFQKDSAAALRVFGNNPLDYNALLAKLRSTGSQTGGVATTTGGVYLPYMDSIKTSLKFLQQNQGVLANGAQLQGQVGSSLTQVNQLQNKMQVTQYIQQQISQHKAAMAQALGQYTHLPAGVQSAYQGYSQQAYYYGAQLKTYSDQFSDPDKLTQKALSVLNQSPNFQSFMKTHSDLSSFFSLPGGGMNGPQALAGLQTKSGIQQQVQGAVQSGGSDGQAAIQSNMQSAKAKLQALKDKVTQAGGTNSSTDVPDFRPNAQKTKSLWGRLQYGVNIQSLPSSYVFPATSTFGASVSYKLNDRNQVGIGAAYLMGWGKDIQHISITGQGASLRSFFETKIKGTWSAYGGFEYNYQQIIYSINQINNLNYWTKSGLIGVTKQYHVSSKVKGELQLLYDVLAAQQMPRTAPVVFRVGYSF
jgi:hypothetical protein